MQEALADLVRIMLDRCYDEKGHKALYDDARGLRGQVSRGRMPVLFTLGFQSFLHGGSGLPAYGVWHAFP